METLGYVSEEKATKCTRIALTESKNMKNISRMAWVAFHCGSACQWNWWEQLKIDTMMES